MGKLANIPYCYSSRQHTAPASAASEKHTVESEKQSLVTYIEVQGEVTTRAVIQSVP